MSKNFEIIMDYIYDNFKFNSRINYSRIKKLFDSYPISFEEEDKVLEELSELKIELLNRNKEKEEHEKILIDCIGESMEIKESELLSWYEIENLNKADQIELKNRLYKHGYLIIYDISRNLSKNRFVSVDDEFFDKFDDLDKVINTKEFQNKLSSLIEVPDKKYNIEYINEYNLSDDENRKEVLNNLVEANTRLVLKIVDKYKRYATSSFDEEDMIQAGMQGLLKAVNKFDTSMEYEFSTYAVYWIKQSVQRNISNYSRTVRIPVHMLEKIRKLTREESRFIKKNNRKATTPELMKLLGYTEKTILDCKRFRYIYNLSSLDATTGEDENNCIGDFVVDERQLAVEESVIEELYTEKIEETIDSVLDERLARILKKRIGLGYKVHTLEEIGIQENLTRERIRQLELKAKRKMEKQFKKGILGYEY